MDFQRIIAEHLTTRRITVAPKTYDETKHSVRVVASTETPVEVFDWERLEVVREVLLAGGFSLRSGEQSPLLDSHSRWSVEDVLGSARNWSKGESTVEADIFFASDEKSVEAEQKVRDGHVTDVSVGYMPIASTFIKHGEKAVVEGKEYEGPIRVTTKWRVHELSLVPIGADQFAKARSSGHQPMSEEEIKRIAEAIHNQQQEPPKPQGVRVMEKETLTPEELAKREQKRVQGIEEISREFATRIKGGEKAMEELKVAAIKLNRSLEEFRGVVFTRVNDGQPLQTPASQLGLTEKETRRYSLARIVQNFMEPSKFDIGFERECHQALMAKGVSSSMGGMLIPWDVQTAQRTELAPFMKRADQTVGIASYGGNLVGTDYQAASFIELLRNKELAPQLGVTYMTGLNQNIAIPRQTAASTWVWVAEQSDYTQSDTTYGQLTMTAKMGGGHVKYSRKLAVQGTPAIEGLVTNDLVRVAALGCDKALFHGTGTNQPTGIVLTSGVGSVAGASFGWPEAVELETDIFAGNGDIGSINHVMSPVVRGLLKTRTMESGFPKYIIENNEMNGYPVKVSNQITDGYIISGVFSEVILADFGNMEILVNPYLGAVKGDVLVHIYRQIDIGVRQPAAFSVATSVS